MGVKTSFFRAEKRSKGTSAWRWLCKWEASRNDYVFKMARVSLSLVARSSMLYTKKDIEGLNALVRDQLISAFQKDA